MTHDDPGARGGRPVDGARRVPAAARRRAGPGGRGRGEQRPGGGGAGGALPPRRDPDGHPDARARRPRGDAADPGGRLGGAGPGADHLQPRRVRLRGAAGRRQRVRAQGRPARAADRRGPDHRRGRGAALLRRHPARDRALHAPAPAASARGGGEPDRAGDGGVQPDHARPLQRRDRRRALHQRHDRQDARHPAAAEARPARPRAGDRARLPDRSLRHVRSSRVLPEEDPASSVRRPRNATSRRRARTPCVPSVEASTQPPRSVADDHRRFPHQEVPQDHRGRRHQLRRTRGPGDRLPRSERCRQVHLDADDGRPHHAHLGQRHHRRPPVLRPAQPGRGGRRDAGRLGAARRPHRSRDPHRRAADDGPPGSSRRRDARAGRPHRRPRRTAGSATTRSACASGSASRQR